MRAIASWKPCARAETVRGSDSGKMSGRSTSSPIARKIQRRSRCSRNSRTRSVLPAQVGALDAEDDPQAGGHHPERRADQERSLARVLRDFHDPILERTEAKRVGQPA